MLLHNVTGAKVGGKSIAGTWEHAGEGETPPFIHVSRTERQGFAVLGKMKICKENVCCVK